MDKSIYLSSVDGYAVNIYGNGTLITLSSDNITIDSLNFVGGDVGVDINASFCKLTNCIFNSTNRRIMVKESDNYVGFCEFNNVNTGVYVTGNRNTIESNKINYCGNYGVNINNAFDVAIWAILFMVRIMVYMLIILVQMLILIVLFLMVFLLILHCLLIYLIIGGV